jgi:hypothetical protein
MLVGHLSRAMRAQHAEQVAADWDDALAPRLRCADCAAVVRPLDRHLVPLHVDILPRERVELTGAAPERGRGVKLGAPCVLDRVEQRKELARRQRAFFLHPCPPVPARPRHAERRVW